MASSSSSASCSSQRPLWKYSVFLSFRGEDTRKTFASHLYNYLNRMGIVTFQDDKRLELGSSIPFELSKAIEESQFAIIIFSKNYASSRWCLEELAKIMKCRSEFGQTVIPVFYDVDPSTIRHQKESFAEAFGNHETRYKDDVEGIQKVQGWRTALTKAADLTGHDIRNRIEAECIQQIIDEIFFKLRQTTPLSSLQDVVGIHTHLEKVKCLLEMEINDVRIIGIWGMGGIGKTTIAKYIFNTLFDRFEAACLLADVKENDKRHQLHYLQNILLSELLKNKKDYVNNKHDGKLMMSSRLQSKKVLIVLDDIDHIDHVEYLAGDLCWFGKGSRIIVTTRNKHLIENAASVYEMITLPHPEAIQLFYQHAFKKEVPNEHFKKLSLEVVNQAKGLPLALKVWGCFLHKRNIIEWENAIEQMKNSTNLEIVELLKISYDGLEPIQQEMFLDITCFFRGKDKDYVMLVLESCFGANIGLSVLIERSLVVISENIIEMHDLIEDMGKCIVNVQKNPGKRSRLWLTEDFEEVMMSNTGTESVEAIWIMNPPKLQISKKALKQMNRLRILGLDVDYFKDKNDVRISFHDDTFKYLSNNLTCFVWNDYHGESLPSNFEPKRLVHLELKFSSLRHLWKERKNLTHLRKLDLSFSRELMETPDFTGMPNLDYLNLSLCFDLKEVHPSLGFFCTKLIRLDLHHCPNLERFPRVNVESLEFLDLRYCNSLEKFPEIIGSMKSELEIHVDFSGIRELPSSIFQYRTHITNLRLIQLENLVTLPNSICKLKNLVTLDVSDCSKLESLPEEIGDLENLEELEASYTLISRPPPSIVRLNKLKILRFAKEEFEEGSFVFPRVNEGLRSLEVLDLDYCNLIDDLLSEDIGCLSTLKRLSLKGINFDRSPRSIARLGALEVLDVSHCVRLGELPELPPSVEELSADCRMAQSIQNYENLKLLICTKPRWVESDDLVIDLFEQTLLRCILSLRKAPRVFRMFHPATKIPILFKYYYEPKDYLLVKLPENWYTDGNFLGFAICNTASPFERTVELLPLSNDDGSEKLSKKLSVKVPYGYEGVMFFFIPLASLWDTSKANGNSPNAYGYLKFSLPLILSEMREFGIRLLYKDDPELEALLKEMEDNHKSTEPCIRIKRSRYHENGEHHDSMTNEQICGSSIFEYLQQQEDGPTTSGILQLFRENPGF